VAAPSTFPLTTFELAALVALAPGPAATQSATSLRIPDPATDPQSKRAGLSSLLVRELATIEGTQIRADGLAGAVAGALTTAETWVEVGVARRESADAAVLVGTAKGALMITPRGYDVWNTLAVAQGTDLVEAGVDLAARGVDVTPDGEPVAVTVKVVTLDGSTTASAHRDADGAWHVALEPADAEGRLTVQPDAPADQAAALARVRDALR
jgi:hypothetical protein